MGVPDPGRPIRSADVLAALQVDSSAPSDPGPGKAVLHGAGSEPGQRAMSRAWSMVDVDFSAVERSRSAVGQAWQSRHGFALGSLPYVLRAVALGLAAFPRLNGEGGADVQSAVGTIDLAIRGDLGSSRPGDPVLRNAQGLGVAELAQALQRLNGAARSGSLGDADFSGSSFGVCDHARHGGVIAMPALMSPMIANLACHQVAPQPSVIPLQDGSLGISIRPRSVLVMSWDERAVDADYAAGFLARVRELLETTQWEVSLPA